MVKKMTANIDYGKGVWFDRPLSNEEAAQQKKHLERLMGKQELAKPKDALAELVEKNIKHNPMFT